MNAATPHGNLSDEEADALEHCCELALQAITTRNILDRLDNGDE